MQRKLWLQEVSRENDARYNNVNEPAPSHLINRLAIIILIFAFTLTTYNILNLGLSEPYGYIFNIYSVLPEILIPSLVICFSIAIVQIDSKETYIRIACTLLLFVLLLTILIIPYLLGYYSMGRADDVSYIGEYVHISNTGNISAENIYPASLIIGAVIVLLVGISANIVSFIIPVFFSSFFVVGLYLFGRIFSFDQIFRNILLISSFLLYLGIYSFLNTPHSLFFAFLPIYLFITFKYLESTNFSFSMMVVLLSILLPFTHPLIFLFVIFFLLCILFFKPLIKELINGDVFKLKNPILIQLIGFMAWFISSLYLLDSFDRLINSFILKLTEPVLLEAADKFATANLDSVNLFSFIIIYYGKYIIPTLFIVLTLSVCYRKLAVGSHLRNSIKLLLIMYVIALIFEGILFINPIVSHQTDRLSSLLLIIYFQVPLFAITLMMLVKKRLMFLHHPKLDRIIIAVVIIIIFVTSIFSTFNSPYVNKPNNALALNEVEGMKWVYLYREGQNMAAPISQISRFHDLFDDGVKDNYTYIQDHFGYNQGPGTFKSINGIEGSLYIVIMTIDKILYEEIPAYQSAGRYKYEDYNKFLNDDSVKRIYSGQNIDISLLC